MPLPKHMIARTLLAALPVFCLALTRPAHGYIDLAPTLTKIIADSPNISVVEVSGYDRDKHVVRLKAVRSLKGTMPSRIALQHQVSPMPAVAVARPVAQW